MRLRELGFIGRYEVLVCFASRPEALSKPAPNLLFHLPQIREAFAVLTHLLNYISGAALSVFSGRSYFQTVRATAGQEAERCGGGTTWGGPSVAGHCPGLRERTSQGSGQQCEQARAIPRGCCIRHAVCTACTAQVVGMAQLLGAGQQHLQCPAGAGRAQQPGPAVLHAK